MFFFLFPPTPRQPPHRSQDRCNCGVDARSLQCPLWAGVTMSGKTHLSHRLQSGRSPASQHMRSTKGCINKSSHFLESMTLYALFRQADKWTETNDLKISYTALSLPVSESRGFRATGSTHFSCLWVRVVLEFGKWRRRWLRLQSRLTFRLPVQHPDRRVRFVCVRQLLIRTLCRRTSLLGHGA